MRERDIKKENVVKTVVVNEMNVFAKRPFIFVTSPLSMDWKISITIIKL